jgi:hypothetical protein
MDRTSKPVNQFTYWFPLEGDKDYAVYNLPPAYFITSVQILGITNEEQIPEALERVRLSMLMKETPDEQLKASAGLPCTFNSETGRYILASTAELAIQSQLKHVKHEFKLISEQDLRALIKKRRGESTSQ